MAIVVKRRKKSSRLPRFYIFAALTAIAIVTIFAVARGRHGDAMPLVPQVPVSVGTEPVKQEPDAEIVEVDADWQAEVGAIPRSPAKVDAGERCDAGQEWPVGEERNKEPKPKRRAGVRVVDKDGNDVFKPRPELKTKTDKFLFSILSRPMGAGRVVLTTYKIEEDFLKSLEAPVDIMPTDTDDEIAIKREIEGWKQWLKEQMDEGVPLVELMEDLKAQVNLAAEEHAFARRKLYKLVKEGKMEEALDYLDTVNATFEKEGVLPLHIPQRLFDRGVEKAEELRPVQMAN